MLGRRRMLGERVEGHLEVEVECWVEMEEERLKSRERLGSCLSISQPVC